MTDYTVFLDLAKEVQPPDKGILSRTLFNDDRLKAVAFGFAQGEELSEHTASMPAVLHFLQGEARLTLGDDTEGTQHVLWSVAPADMARQLQTEYEGGELFMLPFGRSRVTARGSRLPFRGSRRCDVCCRLRLLLGMRQEVVHHLLLPRMRPTVLFPRLLLPTPGPARPDAGTSAGPPRR
jgi:hypothetical protein